jgi:hypothetical protein
MICVRVVASRLICPWKLGERRDKGNELELEPTRGSDEIEWVASLSKTELREVEGFEVKTKGGTGVLTKT